MYYEINRGSSSFNYSLEASLQKRRSLSLSLNYYVHVSAQFLRMNDLVLKFCDDCLAGRFARNDPSLFSGLFDFLKKT